jgi:hypothetical protein
MVYNNRQSILNEMNEMKKLNESLEAQVNEKKQGHPGKFRTNRKIAFGQYQIQ